MAHSTASELLVEIEVLSSKLEAFEQSASSYLRGLTNEQADHFDFRELPYLITRACRLKADLAQQRRKLEFNA